MITKSVRLTLALIACAFTAGALPSFATTITNNGPTVTPVVTTTTNVGTVASSSGTITGVGVTSTFSATYTETVYKDSSNPYCSGCLTFAMKFTNSAGSSDSIEHATNGYLAGFGPYLTNVGYTGSGIAPISADEVSGTIAFNFTGSDAVGAGASSVTFFIQTNATNFSAANFSLIDSETGTVGGYIPAAATPEPSSLLLLGTGLIGLAGVARRRFKL